MHGERSCEWGWLVMLVINDGLALQVWPLAAYFLVKEATRPDFLIPGPGLVLPFPHKKLFRRRAVVPEPIQSELM